MGEGIIGHVADTGRAVNVADARADARYSSDVDGASGSMLCVPIRISGESPVLAVLVVRGVHSSLGPVLCGNLCAWFAHVGVMLAGNEHVFGQAVHWGG